MRSRLRWGIGLVGVLALLAVGIALTRAPGLTAADVARDKATSPADPRIRLLAGQSAPDFSLPALEGGTFRLSEQRGKANVLLFFQEGAMCPPCWQQMRDLKRDQAKLDALNVVLVTITVDPPEVIAPTAAREQVTGMPLLYDKDGQVSRRYDALYVSMHPGQRPGHTFVLIDTGGVIRWRSDFQEMYVPNARVLDPVARALAAR